MKWGEGIAITVKRVHIQGIPEEWCGHQMWEILLTSASLLLGTRNSFKSLLH